MYSDIVMLCVNDEVSLCLCTCVKYMAQSVRVNI